MTSDPGARSLSERELRVLRLIDAGGTAAQVAHELGLDSDAVARTLVEVRRALGVRSTRAAIAVARSLPAWGARPTP